MDEEGEAMVGEGGEKMAPALISVHPTGAAVVVAIGCALRIFDLIKDSAVIVEDATTSGRHVEAIRAVAFSKEGKFLASAGDDKLVKLWDTESWRCIKTTRTAKKITGVTFSQDSKWLLFADKFGVVFVIAATPRDQSGERPAQLLAHCCSIITDLEMSPDGKFIISSDRDFKIRVSVFPRVPTQGSHEIWAYCLGHTSFVTCVAFIGQQSGTEHLLISGSGDGTVRMWDHRTGKLVDTFDTLEVAELGQDEDVAEMERERAVNGIAVSPNGNTVAIIMGRYAGVLLLEYDCQVKRLNHVQSLAFAEQVSPTSIVFDGEGRLWLVAGAAETVDSSDRSVTPEEAGAAESKALLVGKTAVAHVRLIWRQMSKSGDGSNNRQENVATDGVFEWCPDEGKMPGGETLLRALQGSKVDSSVVAVAAEAAELAMRKLMTKRQYNIEQLENRKRMRNDKKVENKRL